MAVITAATTAGGQGVIKVFTFTAIGDGDTFVGPKNAKAFWAQTTADPTTNTSAGINVAESGGTYTFYPGIAALSGTLFVVT
jgi:hypothetical protein